MRTVPFFLDQDVTEAAAAATEVVAAAGTILLPTETFYGLGTDPRRPEGVDRVYVAKGRPSDLALPVLCADWQQVQSLVNVAEEFRVRLSRIWPGALTVILPSHDRLPVSPTKTLAVRIPGHAMLRAVLYRTGPLTGTSANHHGRPACVEAAQALESMALAPDLVLDGGATAGGIPSTLVDLVGDHPRVVRQGPVLWDEPYPME